MVKLGSGRTADRRLVVGQAAGESSATPSSSTRQRIRLWWSSGEAVNESSAANAKRWPPAAPMLVSPRSRRTLSW
jgi:hypothetical protein